MNRTTTASRPSSQPRKLRLHGVIARRLGIGIVGGRYKPGQLLAQEIVASKRLKVSRTAYREAMRILAAKGLVESLPKTGTRISARSRWQLLDPDVLQWLFESEPDDKVIQGLFELRMLIEPAAAAFAAERRNDAQLEKMRGALDAMAKHGLSVEAGRRADCEFHNTLLAATGNEVLCSLSSGITAAVQWTTVYKTRASPLPRDATPDHVRVYEYIRNRDAEGARAAMAELIRLGLEDTQRSRIGSKASAKARGKRAQRPRKMLIPVR